MPDAIAGRTSRRLLLVLAMLTGACAAEPQEHDGSSGPRTDKPDLGYAVLEATEGTMSGGVEGRLVSERCEKRPPIVAPADQIWRCRFSVDTGEAVKDCSADMSIQADDHWALWKTVTDIDPATGKSRPIACTSRPRGGRRG